MRTLDFTILHVIYSQIHINVDEPLFCFIDLKITYQFVLLFCTFMLTFYR